MLERSSTRQCGVYPSFFCVFVWVCSVLLKIWHGSCGGGRFCCVVVSLFPAPPQYGTIRDSKNVHVVARTTGDSSRFVLWGVSIFCGCAERPSCEGRSVVEVERVNGCGSSGIYTCQVGGRKRPCCFSPEACTMRCIAPLFQEKKREGL